MPKKIVTDRNLSIALSELDSWSGKLTWELYGKHLAGVLGVDSISRHTLLSYPELVAHFNRRKKDIKEAQAQSKNEVDFTIESALKQIETLEAKVKRLEHENEALQERFVRWQHNLYMMPNVDMEKLNQVIDRPLVPVNRQE